MSKISGIYKITNTITGDFYIGSSKNIKSRLTAHKCPSTWKKCPNNPMYIDMQKYGVDKFVFEILAEVESEHLKETEQQFIEILKPTYNDRNAKGLDIERYKKSQKKYNKSDKHKESQKKYNKSDKGKESQKKYNKSDKHKEAQKKYQKTEKGKEAQKKYDNQLCCYNGKTITLCALRMRFKKQGISNPVKEAKKYLIGGNND